MDYLEYKGYKGSVEYSKEDNCLFGKVQGMSKDLITYEGQTLDELRKDFEAGIDSYIEGCKADGVEPAKPYSGKLNLRMSSELHSRVAAFVALHQPDAPYEGVSSSIRQLGFQEL